LGKAGTSPSLDEAVYALKIGEVTKIPVRVGDSWALLGVTKREEADLAEFAKRRQELTQKILSERQSQVYEDYIGVVQERLKQEGKIKIYTDVLARMEEEEPEPVAAPPQRPRLPFPTK
jgi:parvulin-like peptidyl-prolyl isomerase